MEFKITCLEKTTRKIEAKSKDDAIAKFREEHDDVDLLEIQQVK